MRLLVAVVSLVSALARSAQAAAIEFELRTSEIANLVYELDCMAQKERCSSSVFEHSWKGLGWTAEDDEALHAWQGVHDRYVRSIDVAEDGAGDLPALPDMPRMLQLEDKLRIAAFESKDLAAYRDHLETIVQPSDAAQLLRIVERFAPRFHGFWITQRPTLDKQARAFDALLRRKDLLDLCAKAAHFYAAELPRPYSVQVNLIAVPQNDTHHTNGTQLERHSVVETEEGERPEARIGVILHELFHSFYVLSSVRDRDRLIARFVADPDPAALTTYGVLNEALATALGNGIVERMLRPADRFAQYRARRHSFYDDDLIDAVAKAAMPALDERLARGGTLYDEDFVGDYVRRARAALGERADRPAEGLRTMVAAILDASLRPAYRALRSGIGGGAVSSCIGDDGQCRRNLLAHKEASGVVFVPAKWVPQQLKPWEPIIGAETRARIAALACKTPPFVFAAHRSPKSAIYVFVGATETDFAALAEAFLRAKTPFVELHPDQ